jgi:hypothetical protein
VIDTLEHAQTRTSAIDVVGPQRFDRPRRWDESIRLHRENDAPPRTLGSNGMRRGQ